MNATLLKANGSLRLSKIWRQDGKIEPAARAAWFEAKSIKFDNIYDLLSLLKDIEHDHHTALVKEDIAPNADSRRVRRKCYAGIDQHTGESYEPGLNVVKRNWLVLDIDGLERPADIDWHDGDKLADYVRGILPACFRNAACIWQLSGSSGHPDKFDEIRMHMFFMCDAYVYPSAWKILFREIRFIDNSIYDSAKLIFTAAPVIFCGQDPIAERLGLLEGVQFIMVPDVVRNFNGGNGDRSANPRVIQQPLKPMNEAANAFVEIISASNILRSQHKNYHHDRARRLSFCSILSQVFGITDVATLSVAFETACIGFNDPCAEHDVQQALIWAQTSPPGRQYSVRKLLCDAASSLREDGKTAEATTAAQLAHYFWKVESGVRSCKV